VEVSEGRRLRGCGNWLHDDRPSPFHGHSKGSKRDGDALLPACTVLLDKRRLRHAMQNDPIIAAGETGILGSRDEGADKDPPRLGRGSYGGRKDDTGKCGGALL